jgi:nucleoside 2-deoxyribosyltransferase
MKKKIYIAGKVTGLPQQEVIEKFANAKKAIEALGFEAVNPLEVVGDWQAPWNKAMRMCIAKLTECDAIALIPDWIDSKGARIEYEITKLIDIPNFRATTFGLQNLKAHKWSN